MEFILVFLVICCIKLIPKRRLGRKQKSWGGKL